MCTVGLPSARSSTFSLHFKTKKVKSVGFTESSLKCISRRLVGVIQLVCMGLPLTSFTPKPGTSFRSPVSVELNQSCGVLRMNLHLIPGLNSGLGLVLFCSALGPFHGTGLKMGLAGFSSDKGRSPGSS